MEHSHEALIAPFPPVPTQRYKLTIAYRGTHYHGWQTQAMNPTWTGPIPPEGEGIPTIQEKLTRAIKAVVLHPLIISGSSRTDTGVHAKGQVAHFDTDKTQIPIEALRQSINAKLPGDILVRKVEAVSDEFEAVSGTRRKRYQYVIWNRPDRPPFFHDMVWHRWQQLNFGAMRQAAKLFEGEHDFTSFARPGHGRVNTVRTIYSCTVSQRGPRVVIGVEGSGFLWNMVRIMVGTLVEVGIGRTAPGAIAEMIAARDRTAAGSTAPAHGLYLQWIQYADEPPAATAGDDGIDAE
jgi:tRNA pseudouridine38-40 synthase